MNPHPTVSFVFFVCSTCQSSARVVVFQHQISGIRYFSIDHMIIGMAIPRMKALPSVLKKKGGARRTAFLL